MKFTKHHIVMILVVLTLVLLIVFFRESGLFIPSIITLLGIYLFILFIGVTRYRLNYFHPAIHEGTIEGISLTFDDGPNPEYTEKVLALLKKYNAKACFFIIGKNIAGNESLLQKIDSEGHIIGNHSFQHTSFFNSLSAKKIKNDIEKCNQKIKELINKDVVFFRVPFGLTSPNIHNALKNTNYISIGWNLRSYDTMAKDADKLYNEIVSKLKSKNIILLHDNNAFTLEMLEKLLNHCAKNGIKIVSLDKMIGKNAYK